MDETIVLGEDTLIAIVLGTSLGFLVVIVLYLFVYYYYLMWARDYQDNAKTKLDYLKGVFIPFYWWYRILRSNVLDMIDHFNKFKE